MPPRERQQQEHVVQVEYNDASGLPPIVHTRVNHEASLLQLVRLVNTEVQLQRGESRLEILLAWHGRDFGSLVCP